MRGVTLEEAVQKTWDLLPPEQREYWGYSDLLDWDSYIPILEMLKSYNRCWMQLGCTIISIPSIRL